MVGVSGRGQSEREREGGGQHRTTLIKAKLRFSCSTTHSVSNILEFSNFVNVHTFIYVLLMSFLTILEGFFFFSFLLNLVLYFIVHMCVRSEDNCKVDALQLPSCELQGLYSKQPSTTL